MNPLRVRALVAFGSVVPGVCAALLACSSAPKLVGPGGECFQATDCQEGLVCAPVKGMAGKSTCTNDLSGIQRLPMMDSGAPRDASADASDAESDAMMQPDTIVADSAAD